MRQMKPFGILLTFFVSAVFLTADPDAGERQAPIASPARPNIDRMASEGLKLTNFYAQPVCGVSRAALLTGCYPIRLGEAGNKKNLHTEPAAQEVFMSQVLKSAGYATALIGKWHLGTEGKGPAGYDPATMPNAKGFDYFHATPLFNGYTVHVGDTKVRSPILRNQEIVVRTVENWDPITGDCTREALAWIEMTRGMNPKGKPFIPRDHSGTADPLRG